MFKKVVYQALAVSLMAFVLAACGPGDEVNLDGTEWALTSLNGSSPIGEANFTLVFSEGRVSGKSGCNSYFSDYTQDGESLSISVLGSTLMACIEPAGLMDQETEFQSVLANVDSFSVKGNQLRLETPDGLYLLFEAQE